MTALFDQREHKSRQKSGSEQPGENVGHACSNIAGRTAGLVWNGKAGEFRSIDANG
jgi:hypothetical protein